MLVDPLRLPKSAACWIEAHFKGVAMYYIDCPSKQLFWQSSCSWEQLLSHVVTSVTLCVFSAIDAVKRYSKFQPIHQLSKATKLACLITNTSIFQAAWFPTCTNIKGKNWSVNNFQLWHCKVSICIYCCPYLDCK